MEPLRRIVALLVALLAVGGSHGFIPSVSHVRDHLSLLSSKTTATPAEQEVNPRLEGLAFMLDDGTRKSHSIAQNSAFVTGFFKGLSTKESYRALLTSLYFVYTSMEEAFDTTTESCVKELDYPELRRVEALSKDMDYFYGSDWKTVIQPSPATRAYVSRVEELSQPSSEKPYLMVAHQYTRYLGDLFGGQMMSGMATRSLDLEAGRGVEFYTFEDIPSANKFITEWYTKLNALDLSEEQKEEIVDEANLVFDLNIGILQELEGSPVKAVWTMMINSLKERLSIIL